MSDPDPDSERPNVLLVLSDEHGARFLGGQAPVATPALDGLAASGTTFAQTYCQVPLCGPSRNCMLTGREQRVTGSWVNQSPLPTDLSTLPGRLGEAGYATCLVGKGHFAGRNQFHGFDHRPYGDLAGGGGHQPEPLDAGERAGDERLNAGVTGVPESALQEYATLRESLAWLREHEARDGGPWFLTASFSRPHYPLTAPRRHVERYWDLDADEPTDRYAEPRTRAGLDHPVAEAYRVADPGSRDDRFARACYLACVDFLDDVVGEFLALAQRDGLLENTVVVYASDHGEMAGEHAQWWKGNWHEGATRVPLVVETPAHRDGAGGHRIERPVSLADLFPTLCGLTGVEPPPDLDGADLSASVRDGAAPDRGPVVVDYCFPQTGPGSPYRVVRDGRWKYVGFRDAPEILYDLEADPHETENLAAGDGEQTGGDAAAGGEPRHGDAAATEEPTDGGPAATALERLRGFVDRTMDFEAYDPDALRERFFANGFSVPEPHALDAPDGPSGNCYLLDGRVVDADTPLYDPAVVVDDPATTYDDWPGG